MWHVGLGDTLLMHNFETDDEHADARACLSPSRKSQIKLRSESELSQPPQHALASKSGTAPFEHLFTYKIRNLKSLNHIFDCKFPIICLHYLKSTSQSDYLPEILIT